jgi:hypothetical protein
VLLAELVDQRGGAGEIVGADRGPDVGHDRRLRQRPRGKHHAQPQAHRQSLHDTLDNMSAG